MRLTNSEIENYVKQLEGETKGIKDDIFRICWYMRGGITYEEAMQMSEADRKIVNEIVKDNLETTKKSGLPFF